MNRTGKIAMIAATSLVSIVLSGQAAAHDDYGHRHPHWKKHRHGHERVVHERVYIERPVYVERYVPYLPPPPPRSPAIVVSVDLPPLVIPLR